MTEKIYIPFRPDTTPKEDAEEERGQGPTIRQIIRPNESASFSGEKNAGVRVFEGTWVVGSSGVLRWKSKEKPLIIEGKRRPHEEPQFMSRRICSRILLASRSAVLAISRVADSPG